MCPVLKWLPNYKREYLVGDLIAGWTVGIIRIPQGMAYALLAGVQPVYGLYSCFFPVLLWFVFSTSKHTSVGTMAVVCLMIQNLITLHVPDLEISQSNNHLLVNGREVDFSNIPQQFITQGDGNSVVLKNNSYITYIKEQHENEKIQIACSATLLVGVLQLVMAFFRLGFITTLLSDPVIQGFTTGSAFHVMTSQVKYLFGLDKSIGKYSGPFAMFKTYGDIFRNLAHANVADVVMSVIALPSLLIVKYLNERYKDKLRSIPIPIELILVVISTMISYFCHLEKPPYDVNIVETIPTGMPSITAPAYINLWSTMLTDCLIMAFVSVAISLSLTKIFADKHGYETDANQEILALGICNTLPAFLSSFAVAASLSRSAIQESTGGKTQLVGVLSSVLMLIVLLWLAPLFQPVPKSVLACIIIVALKSLFMQLKNLKDVWKISKFDFVVWLVTCLAVILLGVDVGLAVGVGTAVCGLLYRIQHPKHSVLGRIKHTDIYVDYKKYRDANEIGGVKIFSFADSVSFTNKDAFRKSLYEAIGCNPSTVISKMKKKRNRTQGDLENMELIPSQLSSSRISQRRNESADNIRKRQTTQGEGNNLPFDDSSLLGFNVLVLDATMWSFLDWSAAREILQIINKLKQLAIVVVLAGVSPDVLQTLDNCGMTSLVTHERVFLSLHDAVIQAEQINQRLSSRNESFSSADPYAEMPGYPGYDSLAF